MRSDFSLRSTNCKGSSLSLLYHFVIPSPSFEFSDLTMTIYMFTFTTFLVCAFVHVIVLDVLSSIDFLFGLLFFYSFCVAIRRCSMLLYNSLQVEFGFFSYHPLHD